jgi:hypothetical protein
MLCELGEEIEMALVMTQAACVAAKDILPGIYCEGQ